jgi:hypothetical protein
MGQGLINPLCQPFGSQCILLFFAYYLMTRAHHSCHVDRLSIGLCRCFDGIHIYASDLVREQFSPEESPGYQTGYGRTRRFPIMDGDGARCSTELVGNATIISMTP